MTDTRMDSSHLYNAILGLGTRRDPSEATRIRQTKGYTQQALDSYYRRSWACRRVVEIMPRFMCRKWGTPTLGGENNSPRLIDDLQNKYAELKVRNKFKLAQTWANLYGRCHILLVTDSDDFGELTIGEEIKELVVLDRWKLYPDPTMTEYSRLNPEYYTFLSSDALRTTNLYLNAYRSKDNVHRSRVLVFTGNNLPDNEKIRNNACEDSVLEPFIDVWKRFFTGYASLSNIINDFDIFTHYIDGLFEGLLLGGEKAKDDLYERLETVHVSKSIYGGLVGDLNKEKFEYVSRNLGGVGDIADRLQAELVAASGLPKSVLFGEFAAGLDASGKITGEQSYLNDLVGEAQTDKFSDNINDLNKFLAAPTKKIFGWQWHPLYTETAQSNAEIRKLYAEIDEININTGIYSQEEARSRYESKDFNSEIILNRTDRTDEAGVRLSTLERVQGRVRFRGRLYIPNKPYYANGQLLVLATKNGFVRLVKFGEKDVNLNAIADNPHLPVYWANLFFSFAQPKEDNISDAPNYGPAVSGGNCGNCARSYTGNRDGTGWINCDAFDFEVKRDYVCDDWLSKSSMIADDATPTKKIIQWQGFSIGLQYLPFETRHKKTLLAGYGHFRKTKGADNMACDVYVGMKLESPKLFVVEQYINGEFDEDKFIVGVETLDEARNIYLSAMPEEFLGSIREEKISYLQSMQCDSQIAVGSQVSWKWGTGRGTGKVRAKHTAKITRTIKGAAVTRNGTPDNPALEIEQENGDVVLKLASEVNTTNTDADKITVPGEVLSEDEFDAIADVTDTDIADAVSNWKKTAPDLYTNLLDTDNEK
jgi:phage-related protein (TIGR01555 family)